MLDSAFPRVRGDVGCAETFDFPVRHRTVEGATVADVVHHNRSALLPAFVAAGNALAREGCIGLATTCGFTVRWQRELAAALPVPILTSALLALPLIASTLRHGKRVGVVTYSARDVTPEILACAGANAATPVAGVEPGGYFARTIRDGAPTLDSARMEADTLAAARRLAATHRDVGAIVLECANMPPYRDAVSAAVGLPVYDAVQLIGWFHAGLRKA